MFFFTILQCLSFHVHQRNKEIAYLLANNFPTVTALLLFCTNFLEALSLYSYSLMIISALQNKYDRHSKNCYTETAF